MYTINTGKRKTREMKGRVKDGSHSRQLVSPVFRSFLSNAPPPLLCAPRRLPLRAYDQVVALSSIRQGEIKHATVTRHTRRIQLQPLTCDIKKPASVRHVDKRDAEGEREREGDVMSEEMKAFQLLID